MGPAAINIQMVRENLALAIAFWAAAQRGVITSATVPAKTAFKSITNDFLEVETPLELADNRELVRCVSNQLRSAFAFSAIQTYRSLEKTYRGSPLQEPDPNLRGARCSFYVLNKTVAQNLLSPVWVCPPDYRTRFEVRDVAFCLDAAKLDGKEVFWDDFGAPAKLPGPAGILLPPCGRRYVRTTTGRRTPRNGSPGDSTCSQKWESINRRRRGHLYYGTLPGGGGTAGYRQGHLPGLPPAGVTFGVKNRWLSAVLVCN